MENLPQTIGTKEVEARVIELRGQKVILDRDVAELYQTETREINKAVKNNPEKFPDGYCFTLQPSEKQYVVENFHRMERLKKSTVEPRAFTERGLYIGIHYRTQPYGGQVQAHSQADKEEQAGQITSI